MFFRLVSRSGFFPDFIDAAVTKTALLAFDQRGADRGDFFRCFLLLNLTLADQFADNFALVAEMPCLDLRFDPAILLIGDGYAFFMLFLTIAISCSPRSW